ncbi:MAG TPA: prolipoprotein diacylglyceryl transferase family protein [Candidatus Limnocylindria bacterium]|nr:prolipoprotein diacylglyceryl transferase family protein [Candidatus Limnocylindria bacterium]
MPLAVLTIAFDPVLRLSETASVRYETIAVAVVLLLGLVVASRIGAITPVIGASPRTPGLPVDDLVFIAVGVVPGAILGARLGYVLDHLDFYKSHPNSITDVSQGGLTLGLAVPFGILTGILIARLLGAPVGRWMHALALPVLFVLGAGKLVGILGASGQGTPADLAWATAYQGPGPWASLGADVPAHPAQAYEAIGIALAIALLWILTRIPGLLRREGAALFVALALWAIVRLVVATTWRDPIVTTGLRMEQLLALAALLMGLLGFMVRRRARPPLLPDPPEPDPEIDVEARLP